GAEEDAGGAQGDAAAVAVHDSGHQEDHAEEEAERAADEDLGHVLTLVPVKSTTDRSGLDQVVEQRGHAQGGRDAVLADGPVDVNVEVPDAAFGPRQGDAPGPGGG